MGTSFEKIRGDPPQWLGGWRWRADRLGRWVAWYCAAVVSLFAAILVTGPLAFLAYLGIGWWIGRRVWRDVMWLESDEGVDLTAHAEVWFILTWLWSHPVLIVAAWVTRSD